MIGHSLGGYLSLRYALHFPERIRALVLVNPFYTQSQLPLMLRFFLRRPLLNNTIIKHTPYWLFRLMIDVTSLQFGGSNETFHTLPEKMYVSRPRWTTNGLPPAIYNIPRTLHDLTPDLTRVTQPTLVIWGARDQTINPKTFPSLVERLPNALSEVLPVCGHVPHQCHATEFNKRVFGFLGSL